MTFDEIKSTLAEKFSNAILDSPDGEEDVLYMNPKNWNEIAAFLQSDDNLFFDQMECLTGMDLGAEESLEVRYNLHSMKHRHKVEIRISADRNNPNIPSVEQIWRMADWFEREAYDMYGIQFDNHPDLRRIYMWEEFEGYPMRKDFPLRGYKDAYNPFGEE